MRTRRSRGDSPMCAGLIAVFRRREGRIIPGGSTPLEKGTARWVRNYDLWRKERKVQETNRHELRYDVVVVGGGSAGLSAALILGRSRRQTLVVDAGEPRNAPSSGVHGFFSRDGISPEELLEIGREQLEPYPSVEVRSARVSGTSGVNGDFEVILDDGSVVRARKLLLATGVVDELPDKPGFEELWGSGVYHCPYCHGWEVRDRPLAVLNPGGEAAERAAFIRNWSRDLALQGGTVLEVDAPQAFSHSAWATFKVRDPLFSHLYIEDAERPSSFFVQVRGAVGQEHEVAAPVSDEGRALGRLLAGSLSRSSHPW